MSCSVLYVAIQKSGELVNKDIFTENNVPIPGCSTGPCNSRKQYLNQLMMIVSSRYRTPLTAVRTAMVVIEKANPLLSKLSGKVYLLEAWNEV